MKRWKWIVATALFVGIVIAVLAHNRQILQERRNQNVMQTVIPVVIQPAQWDTLSSEFELVGTVSPNNAVQVAAEAGGRVIACNIDLGRSVRQGDILYVLDDELRRAQLLTAEANFAKAQSDSARYWFLKQNASIPDAQWDQILLQYRLAEAQLIQARRAFNDTRIRAPISGVITAKRVDVGTMVSPGTPVCDIVDKSRMKVFLDVAERDIFLISVGTPVEIHSDVLPEQTFQGHVTAIAPKASESHTFPVEITIKPPYGELKPGMFVRVRFLHVKPIVGLMIPRDAIIGSLENAKVYVVDTTAMIAHERRVRCGIERQGYVVVLSGIAAGEPVVVTGNNVLSDGAQVIVSSLRGNNQ